MKLKELLTNNIFCLHCRFFKNNNDRTKKIEKLFDYKSGYKNVWVMVLDG